MIQVCGTQKEQAVNLIQNSAKTEKTAALYIHIPFCSQKCAYCDFFSANDSRFLLSRDSGTALLSSVAEAVSPVSFSEINPLFLTKLLEDAVFFKQKYGITDWNTIYIGGGTPSLLSPDAVRSFASALRNQNTSCAVQEFTIEANPEDVTEQWLSACQEGGINRISLGVQSFQDSVLQASRRRGSSKKTHRALAAIKQGWKGTVSCDLIAGLPQQFLADLCNDIKTLISYGVQHISLYGLCSETELPDAQEALITQMLKQGRGILQEHTFVPYEVSNFSYNNQYKSIHNCTYWNMHTSIGIGPAAVGTIVHEDTRSGRVQYAERFEGIRNTGRWYDAASRLSGYSYSRISPAVFLEEVLLMGFRLTDGINRCRFKKQFGSDITAFIGNTLEKWERQHTCVITADAVHLTQDGLLFLNTFLVEAFSELEHTVHKL
ncbi:MAG: coproporphyrinogen-III oxidase family protein [Treponema sp.]